MEKLFIAILVLSVGVFYPVTNDAAALFRSSKKALEDAKDVMPKSGDMSESPELHRQVDEMSDSSNSMMESIAQSAGRGVGKDLSGGPYCYRSVKKIIADGLGKNLGCVRGIVYGGEAKDALTVLPRAGFKNDMSKCHTKGVIRVYKGRYPGYGKKLAGDTAGHIEVLGSDGNYHSFYESPISIDQDMKGRRILSGCFVPDEDKIRSGPLGRCKGATTGSAKKTKSKVKAKGGKS